MGGYSEAIPHKAGLRGRVTIDIGLKMKKHGYLLFTINQKSKFNQRIKNKQFTTVMNY
jgi:hypothetical protein